MLNKIPILLVAFFLYSCSNKQTKPEVSSPNKFSFDDIVGEWDVFHIGLTKGRNNPSRWDQILFKVNFSADDSLKLRFNSDSTFSINKHKVGVWTFENDSIKLENINNTYFPLNIDSKYRVHQGYRSKNQWYLFTEYYDRKGKVTHSVRLMARRK